MIRQFDRNRKKMAAKSETPKAFIEYGLSWRATAYFLPPK